jgi:predicted TIM-barrel fold metal-dependent hydrolase
MTSQPTPLIDVHAHPIMRQWLDALARSRGPDAGPLHIAGSPVPDWSPQIHLAMLDRHGIDAALLSWPSATAFLTGQASRALARSMNEELAQAVADHPHRFGAFAILPWDDMDAVLEEMAYALDVLHLDGVSAATQYRGSYLGSPAHQPVLAEMNRRGTTLFVHPTTPPGFDLVSMGLNAAILEFMFDSTRMATNMVLSGSKARFPDIRIICTHGGGTVPYLAARIGILEPHFGAGEGRPVLTAQEVQAGLASFYYDLTAATSAAQIDAIRRLVPVERLLMGFDYPMMPEHTVVPARAAFDAYAGLDAAERARINGGNALAMFPALAQRMKAGR